jgi:Ser/Thr protein kinase RdoA (MazF antagonist)
LQKLHKALASDAIAEDLYAVTTRLADEKFPAPMLVETKKGQKTFSYRGHTWRMQTFIPGRIYEVVRDAAMAKEAGGIYARFHAALTDMEYQFKSPLVLHETEKEFQRFEKTIRAHRGSERMEEVAEEVVYIMKELPKLFLPTDLPLRVIHGDPKISNIVFGAKGKAKGVIDLDTCNRRTVLVDLGDAFRSWCGKEEDDPDNTFRLPIFRAAWKGYWKEGKHFLSARERRLVPKAVGTITLELASRFLRDYFEDSYFGWDPSRYESRREHNLARARGQIAEYLDYKSKLKKVREIVMK